MPSPFPGMDPYIEGSAYWSDFHMNMLAAIRTALNRSLPEGYMSHSEVHVRVREPDSAEEGRRIVPDGLVLQDTSEEGTQGSVAQLTAPARTILPIDFRAGTRFLQVIELEHRRVVTVLELLSPSNKAPGPDREAYIAKRAEYLAGGVHLVEIDLLRGGVRLPVGEEEPERDYYCLVCQAEEAPEAGIWNFGLRDPLPEIPIPLRAGDGEVPLALQDCMVQTYDTGRYLRSLPYHNPPTPRLSEADAQWAQSLLAPYLNQ